MFKKWWYSLLMLLVYLATFLAWKHYPSRISFVALGSVSAALLTRAMILAAWQAYFANRTDLLLHAYVIVDVLLEAFMYELFLKAIVWLGILPEGGSSHGLLAFHDNNNFYFCATFFTAVIGLHRFVALRRRNGSCTAEPGSTRTGAV